MRRHTEIANDIRAKIKDGTYTKQLPSWDELLVIYGVSNSTLLPAIRELKAEGIIVSQKGLGIFVNMRSK